MVMCDHYENTKVTKTHEEDSNHGDTEITEIAELHASHVGRQRRPTSAPVKDDGHTSATPIQPLVCPSFFMGAAAAFAAASDASVAAVCATISVTLCLCGRTRRRDCSVFFTAPAF